MKAMWSSGKNTIAHMRQARNLNPAESWPNHTEPVCPCMNNYSSLRCHDTSITCKMPSRGRCSRNVSPLLFLFWLRSLIMGGDPVLEYVILQFLITNSLMMNPGDRKLCATNSYHEKAVPTVTGKLLAGDRGAH